MLASSVGTSLARVRTPLWFSAEFSCGKMERVCAFLLKGL